jgi:hypothetical protein
MVLNDRTVSFSNIEILVEFGISSFPITFSRRWYVWGPALSEGPRLADFDVRDFHKDSSLTRAFRSTQRPTGAPRPLRFCVTYMVEKASASGQCG